MPVVRNELKNSMKVLEKEAERREKLELTLGSGSYFRQMIKIMSKN